VEASLGQRALEKPIELGLMSQQRPLLAPIPIFLSAICLAT